MLERALQILLGQTSSKRVYSYLQTPFSRASLISPQYLTACWKSATRAAFPSNYRKSSLLIALITSWHVVKGPQMSFRTVFVQKDICGPY